MADVSAGFVSIGSRSPTPVSIEGRKGAFSRISSSSSIPFGAQKAEPETLVHLLGSLKVMPLPGLIVRGHVKTFTTHLLILQNLESVPLAGGVRPPHVLTLL